MPEGTEPIDDQEVLYRRIPVKAEYFNIENAPEPTPMAFRPRKNDSTGLSVYRGKHKSIEDVATNPRGKRYYVAILRAGDLREYGIEVVPRPNPGDEGHAEIATLTYENRNTEWGERQQMLLAEKLCVRVEGPFGG